MIGYDAHRDPYCYKGTSVLKNRQGIRRQDRLAKLETALATQRALEPLPRGYFGSRHYRAIHRHLFGDIYRWAGSYRTVRMSKGTSHFCYPEYITDEINKLFTGLAAAWFLEELSAEEFSLRAAEFLAELNAIHPFREGNGRAQLSFMGMLSVRAGHPLVLERIVPDRFLAAMIESFAGSKAPLVEELRRLIGPR